MATWKKVIVSGSNAELNQITSSGGINAILPSSQQANFVSYNLTTGQLGYFGTGSLTAATASFITASNVWGPFGTSSISSASFASSSATTAITDTTTGTGPYYVTFVAGTSGNQPQLIDSSTLTYNATANVLTTTSSFASASLSSSYAVSSSYTLFATSASFASSTLSGSYALTASYVLNSVSASYASSALSSSYAISSSYTLFATSASFATSVNNLSNAIANNADNRVLTATGGGTINGEANLTFDGTTLTVTGNEIITGNLIVQGTASFQNTTNLEVADRFILLASGSNSAGDGGLIIQQANQNVGELFGYENSINRWGFTSSFSGASSSFTAVAFVTTTEVGTTAPSAAPVYGGASNGLGNIYVRSSTEEIFIYS